MVATGGFCYDIGIVNHERRRIMKTTLFMALITLPLFFLTIGGIIYLFVLLCKALKNTSHPPTLVRNPQSSKNLWEKFWKIIAPRTKWHKNLVAEAVGVSRQSRIEVGAGNLWSQHFQPFCSGKTVRCLRWGTAERSWIRNTNHQSHIKGGAWNDKTEPLGFWSGDKRICYKRMVFNKWAMGLWMWWLPQFLRIVQAKRAFPKLFMPF